MGDDRGFIVAMTVLVLVAMLSGFVIGSGCAAHCERAAAVEAGVARYEVDATTGEVRFVYMTPGK